MSHAATIPFGVQGTMPKVYAKLSDRYPVRPIHSDAELNRAQHIVDLLAGRSHLTRDQMDYLDAWATMVEAYEKRRYASEYSKRSPIEMLKFLLKENGMCASDLGRLLGSRQLGWKILNGKRNLSKAHIRKLAERFAVNASLFLD